MKATHALFAALMTLTATVPALAHHSFAAEFDGQKPFRVTGALVKIEWTNPHTYFYVDVKNAAGKVENWSFQTYAPITLRRNGT